MIKAIIYAAAVLLIFQIGLTVAVHQQQAVNLESTAPDSAFLSFTPGSITSVEITGPEGEELILEKSGNGWIMPRAFSAPASQGQIDELLKKLAEAHQGLAVATTKGAAKRFKTAEDNFERHVVLRKGDAVAGDFYLGTSAGVRNSHVRKADQDAVVSIPVGSHEVDVDADSWLDRSLANLSKDELKAVTLGDISLTKKKEDKESIWTLEGASKEETNKDEVDSLLSKITALSVQSVLDPVKSAELLSKAPAVEFTVTKEDDSKLTYAFAKNDDEKDAYFILKMSNNDLYFKVGKWLVEGLTEAKREKLLVGYEEPKEKTPAAAEQGAPALDLPAPAVEQAVLPEFPEEDVSDQTDQAVQEELSEQGEQDGEALTAPESGEDAVAPAAEEAETADEAAPVEQETEDSQEEEAALPAE